MSDPPHHPRSCELETQIAHAMIRFEKEFMGRGPIDTRAFLLDDMILVRLKGVLTPSERKLSESQSNRSAYLLKQVRNELLESGRHLLEVVIHDIVGVPLRSVHTDISTKTGERIFVFSLESAPKFNGQEGNKTNGKKQMVAELIGESNQLPSSSIHDENHRQNASESSTTRS